MFNFCLGSWLTWYWTLPSRNVDALRWWKDPSCSLWFFHASQWFSINHAPWKLRVKNATEHPQGNIMPNGGNACGRKFLEIYTCPLLVQKLYIGEWATKKNKPGTVEVQKGWNIMEPYPLFLRNVIAPCKNDCHRIFCCGSWGMKLVPNRFQHQHECFEIRVFKRLRKRQGVGVWGILAVEVIPFRRTQGMNF